MNILSPVFSGLTRLRAQLFAHAVFKQVRLPISVIGIGNLTMGGTGKTPFLIWLLQKYQHQYKIGVVVRSYKANLKASRRVEIGSFSSAIFGDEAVLIQEKLPQVIVYSGPSKSLSAQKLYDDEKPNLIFVDDGFQHLKLYRNLDIVLLDTSVPLSDYSWPPFGRLREDFSALKRAAVVVLTKVEIKNSETYIFLKKQIAGTALVLESSQKIGTLKYIGGASHSPFLKGFNGKKVFAFAGLARPENFRLSLKRFGLEVAQFLPLADHVDYSFELMSELVNKTKEFDFCVTTEKDAVKLGAWPKNAPSLFAADVELEMHGNIEELFKKIEYCLGGVY